jgi:hypothetical protein
MTHGNGIDDYPISARSTGIDIGENVRVRIPGQPMSISSELGTALPIVQSSTTHQPCMEYPPLNEEDSGLLRPFNF